ncbi:MAG: hypothetical protein ACKOQ6_10565, partial [Bacteroidota bacterium]
DANSCTASTSATINNAPLLLTVTETIGTIACNGGSTTLTVNASGGTSPYTGTGSFTRNAGAYTYTVTDNNGCTGVVNGVITQPSVLTASASAGVIICIGGGTNVVVSATGGTSPYTGTGTFVRSAGAYAFTVTDANGCTSSVSGNIAAPTSGTAISVTAVVLESITCNGGTTRVDVTASGGTGVYTSGTGITTGVLGGSQTFLVIDSQGCSGTATINVRQPVAISITGSSSVTACTLNGTSFSIRISGGTLPYVSSSTSYDASGNCIYTVVDANGCSKTSTINR